MKQDFYYLSKDKKTNIHASKWVPQGEPKAILQISHGMVEHIGRYDDFAQYLADHGFYVTGNDHLGHGGSVTSEEKLGFFEETRGNECVIGDIHELRQTTEKKFPGVPYFILGHSMGSFLVRQYIELYGEGLKGALLLGTGCYPEAALKFGLSLCRTITAAKGPMHRSRLLENIVSGNNNKHFAPIRTTHDWLTKDEQIIDKYMADPWCSFTFTVNAYYHMFRGIEYMQKKEHLAAVPKDLPLLLASGEEDPVGKYGKNVRQSYDAYQKAGIRDLSLKLYPNDRHEILNELDRAQVYEDLRLWMEARI